MKVETQVSLSIRGLEVEPTEVASSLNMEFVPEFSNRRGDPAGVGGEAVQHEEGFCCFVSRGAVPTSAAFEEHMAWMLARLEPHRDRLREWSARGWHIELKTYTVTDAASGGPVVRPELMRRIVDLGVTTVWRTLGGHVFRDEL